MWSRLRAAKHGGHVNEGSVKPVGAPAMVNASLVNGRESRFRPPPFREFLPVLGQIPHIQNPFKNKRIGEINGKTVHPASRPPRRCAVFPVYSVAYPPLKVPERPFPYNCGLRENAWSSPKREDSHAQRVNRLFIADIRMLLPFQMLGPPYRPGHRRVSPPAAWPACYRPTN